MDFAFGQTSKHIDVGFTQQYQCWGCVLTWSYSIHSFILDIQSHAGSRLLSFIFIFVSGLSLNNWFRWLIWWLHPTDTLSSMDWKMRLIGSGRMLKKNVGCNFYVCYGAGAILSVWKCTHHLSTPLNLSVPKWPMCYIFPSSSLYSSILFLFYTLYLVYYSYHHHSPAFYHWITLGFPLFPLNLWCHQYSLITDVIFDNILWCSFPYLVFFLSWHAGLCTSVPL